MVKIVNSNNKPMKKPQINSREHKVFKNGYIQGIKDCREELIEEFEKIINRRIEFWTPNNLTINSQVCLNKKVELEDIKLEINKLKSKEKQ